MNLNSLTLSQFYVRRDDFALAPLPMHQCVGALPVPETLAMVILAGPEAETIRQGEG